MATTITNRIPSRPAIVLRPLVLAPILVLLVFLALPWSVEHKAHMLLHGLCAQQPSHTYRFGDRLLPFDARMTGIYSGYLVTTVVLFAQGAQRWCRPPSISRLLLLMLLGGSMAADGLNSFLADLGLTQLYEPRNWLRLATGLAAGVVLGFALCFLTASSLWTQVDTRKQTLQTLSILPIAAVGSMPIALAVVSGVGALYVPLTLMLVFSAALALTTVSLVVLVILRRRDFTFAGIDGLGGYGAGAVGLAVLAMALLAIVRTVLERSLGTPPLT